MKTVITIILGVMLSLFAISLASAQNWQTIYETDFSVDPGWTTNNPSYFYWNPADNTYSACQYNVNGGGYFTGYNAGYNGGSFLLEWDIEVNSEQYASDLCFGIYDADFNTSHPCFVRVAFTHNDQGNHTFFEWRSADATYGYAFDTNPQWVLDTPYRVSLEYDAEFSQLTVDIRYLDDTPFASYTANGVSPFDSDMGHVGSSNIRDGNFQCPGCHTCGRFDNVKYSLEANSLLIPSVSVFPCDDSCVMQPVQTMLTEPIKGATIPLKIPEGVEVCSLSTQGLMTENWEYNILQVKADSGFLLAVLANSSDNTIPEDTTTVFNIFFYAAPECVNSTFIHWDTSLYDDYSRQLKFADTLAQVINPAFDVNRDSTEILGYTPGDCTCDGIVDISDLVCLVDFMFTGGARPCIMNSVDVNGDGGPQCDIADLVYLVDYMFNDGPAPVCGNISAGSVAKAVAHPQIVVAVKVDNGMTTISLAAPFDLRGLQLELLGPDGAAPITLLGDNLDMVYGQEGERVKIGILDLDGGNVIPAGENRVIQLQGEYEIVSAFVAADGYTTYAATIGGAKGSTLPEQYSLAQNYPNPFNPVTTISFSLPVASDASLIIYNVMGQKVATVADGFHEAGIHSVEWDGSSVASGVYFYRIETDAYTETKKMLLLK